MTDVHSGQNKGSGAGDGGCSVHRLRMDVVRSLVLVAWRRL